MSEPRGRHAAWTEQPVLGDEGRRRVKRPVGERAGQTEKLLVNPIECEGHGVCAELLPEMITLDEWGYPIVDGRPLPPGLERDARAAVSACPTLALRLLRS
jgi:ferredoxin